jgi:hypothetical protein
MNRQLRADGGIMQIAPREKFGLGSKLKKFVRKIIPNEVAEIAVKAAPFVAPFNPAVAAAMSGLGSFDKSGRIGDSLKSAALTYGMGQGARYLGGAELQGNPFQQGGAFRGGFEGFKGGFSSPLGTQSGFKLGKPVGEVQGVGNNNIIPKQKPNLLSEQMSEVSLSPSGAVADTTVKTVTDPGSAMDSLKSIVSFDTSAGQKGKAALDLLKRGSKALFYTDGKLDKNAVLGAVTAATSYAEALMLAKDAGVDLTEKEYDQAQRNEKKEEYAGYLQNFFGGKKDGGRIGFESGANEMIKTQLLEEIMPDTSTEDFVIIMTEDGPVRVKKSDYDSMPGMFRDTTTGEGSNMFRIKEADGGRIGYARGSEPEEAEIGIMSIDVEAGDDEDEEDMMMAGGINFSRAEKAYLFKRLGGGGGADRSYTMPSLYRILNNPNRYPRDARILKEIVTINLGEGQKDGGRIGYKGGANRVSELLILRDNLLANGEDVSDIEAEIFQLTGKTFKSVGGISDIPTGKIRKNSAGVVERDYRDEGGFVPVGIKERADDVPAMLSKNEFVMTADAVRGIGNGSVEEGSKKLYNTMKKAEQVGKA